MALCSATLLTMELLQNLGLIAAGVGFLYYGAEWLVKGSSAIALRLGVSPLVIGLTIVALGTSSPELAVCVGLNLAGNGATAIGNVVGSNICNILLVLGVSALVRPILIKAQLIIRDAPILIGVSLLFMWFIHDGSLVIWEGILLTVLIVAYTIFSFWVARHESNPEVIKEFEDEIGTQEGEMKSEHSPLRLAVLIIVGIAVLVLGAKLLKDGALYVAHAFGVSDAIIGLSLVAIGTSLPELATSIVASMKNEGDIITGNAIGSSIFNILAVLGITILVRPMAVEGIEPIDVYFMLGSAVLVLPLMWTRKRLSRREGVILLAIYLVYCIQLVQRGQLPV